MEGPRIGRSKLYKKYEKYLAAWISEPDKGMYDAINKGFAMATGDIYAWINSDDTYLPEAFQVIAKSFQRYPECNWLTGASAYIDESKSRVDQGKLHLYHRLDLERGHHGLWLPFVQQNCCFWRSELWDVCAPIPSCYKYTAGDYWLWIQFASHSQLHSVNQPVATLGSMALSYLEM